MCGRSATAERARRAPHWSGVITGARAHFVDAAGSDSKAAGSNSKASPPVLPELPTPGLALHKHPSSGHDS